MFNDRHKYRLQSPLGEIIPKADPMGWDKAETEIGRSEATFGIFLTVTNNLEFTGEEIEFLERNHERFGVNADVRLTKYIKNDYTDEWQLAFTGKLDFTTRRIENNRFIIDFVEGGLREILVSQIREKFEMGRSTDIKGRSIPALIPDTLRLQGREIFLLSKLRSESTTEFRVRSGIWSSGDSARVAYRPAPLAVTANSDPENIKAPTELIGSSQQHLEGEAAETKFFFSADRQRSRTKLHIKMSFRIQDVYRSNSSFESMRVILRRYEDNTGDGGSPFDPMPSEDINLVDWFTPQDNHLRVFNIDRRFDLMPQDLPEGTSYAILFVTSGAYGGTLSSGQMQVYIDQYSAIVDWSEDSDFSPTSCQIMTALDIGKRLTEIYTGKEVFKSKLLTGMWRDLGITSGGWIRNLQARDEGWPLTISWEEFYNTINAIEPAAYGIITRGNQQRIALEDRMYFFQPYVTVNLGEVTDLKRSTAPDFIHSSITTGYKKGGDYEKPLGLDEPNVQLTYTTPVTALESKYEVLADGRADSYGVEDARRMQAIDYPDEDTPYDDDNFIIDAKRIGTTSQKSTFEVRLWNDDFDYLPMNIYSPETAFNLRISPAHNMVRHSRWFNNALWKFRDEKLRFASSTGNSELVTDIRENDDFVIGNLLQPFFEPEWIEFEIPRKQEVVDALLGHTEIAGELMNNYYGQVEFTNNEGMRERAFIFSAKIQDTIKFKLLKTYGG